ncbi:MAG: hypothetical protein JWP37_41, partial [Mucilaginibacter sp.]|nr:hypothetical protein [Mucilaginibacter sp.]
MKINFKTAIVFTVLGLALFIISMVTHNEFAERWTSFAFGLSFPLFIAGIVSIVIHLKQ